MVVKSYLKIEGEGGFFWGRERDNILVFFNILIILLILKYLILIVWRPSFFCLNEVSAIKNQIQIALMF